MLLGEVRDVVDQPDEANRAALRAAYNAIPDATGWAACSSSSAQNWLFTTRNRSPP